MPRYTFDAYYPDGSPRLFVGMWRPPYDEALRAAGLHPEYVPVYYQAQFERGYALGKYDRRLYALDDKVDPEPDRTQRHTVSRPEPRVP